MNNEHSIAILLVEDDDIDRRAVERLIRREELPYALTTVRSVSEAMAAAGDARFDVALVDYKLPDGTGLDVQRGLGGKIPCVFITAADDHNTTVEVMKAGAYDFLVKDPNRDYLQLLPSVIDAVLERWRERAQIELQGRIIESLSEIVLQINESGDVVFANNAVQSVLGYAPEEILGQNWWERVFTDSDQRAAAREEIIARARGERPLTPFDIALHHKNGREVSIEWSETRAPGGGIICVGHDVTEQRAARHKLEQSEAQLNAILEFTPAIVSLKDKNYRYVYVNSMFEEIFGLESLRVLNRTDEDLFSPENVEVMRRQDEGVLSGGGAVQFEHTLMLPDGEHIYITVKFPMLDEHGRPFAVCGMSMDVTDARRTGRAARLLVEGTAMATGDDFFKALARNLAGVFGARYALITETIDNPASIVRTIAFWAGDDFAPNFEYALAETPCGDVYKSINEMCFFPHSVQSLFPKDKDLLQMEAESFIGIPIYSPDSQFMGHIAILDIKPMKESEGLKSVLHIFASRAAAELERRRFEERLILAQKQWEETFDAIEDMVAVLDSSHHVVLANKAMREGFPGKNIVGSFCYELFHDSSNPIPGCPSCTVFSTGEATRMEAFEPTLDRWLDVNVFPIAGPDGDTPQTVHVVRDITSRKLADDELLRHRDHLEELVRERTSELSKANEELKKLSQRIITTQEEERAALSRELHDSLGQQLTALLLEIDWIKERQADVEPALTPMSSMVENMAVEVRRICRGLRPMVLDHMGLETALIGLAREFDERRDFSIDIDIEGLGSVKIAPQIEISMFRVQQEALNNIAKYAEAKNVEIRLRRDGNVLELKIRDDGLGVERAALQKLSFGIAGMRERAALCGGTLDFTSEPGRGTAITMRVPI